jgi:hypothetical protein
MIVGEWRSGRSAPIGRDGEQGSDALKTHARVVMISSSFGSSLPNPGQPGQSVTWVLE